MEIRYMCFSRLGMLQYRRPVYKTDSMVGPGNQWSKKSDRRSGDRHLSYFYQTQAGFQQTGVHRRFVHDRRDDAVYDRK